jgi:hypothetical protein
MQLFFFEIFFHGHEIFSGGMCGGRRVRRFGTGAVISG